jgi:hypothetical protein
MENNGLSDNGGSRARVLIVGAGFAGFTCARELEKRLRPADADPATFIEGALEDLRQRACLADAHSTALAVDAHRWELVHFTLFAHTDQETAGTLYEVLHLSAAHSDDIGVGRHW